MADTIVRVPEFQAREPALFKFAILTDGILVFFMQVGFVALEVGSGRKKNVRNILLKNTVCVMLSSLCWWACGYALAYGKSAGGVIGRSYFFYDAGPDRMNVRPFFFGWAFMLCSNTIVSGCLAERTNLVAYPVYTIALSTFIHPVAAHWSWADASWLNNVSGSYKFLDFAGGTSVHLVGGIVGLVGAALAGPRIGRFEDGSVKNLTGHDMTFATIGTFMLWFGWYGFNCGATYLYRTDAVRRVALNTTLLGSTSGLVSLLLVVYLTGTYDLVYCCNGLLAGLVMASSTSGYIHAWGAFVLGVIAACVYILNSRLLIHFGVDDPLDSAAVHGLTGLLGTLMLGFFADPEYVRELLGDHVASHGIFYGAAGFKQFGIQLLGVSVILACTVAVAYSAFAALAQQGLLRVDQTTELAGIDMVDHLGPDFSHVSQLSERHNRSVHTSPDTSGD